MNDLNGRSDSNFLKSLGYLGSWVLIAIISALMGVLVVGSFLAGIKWVRGLMNISSGSPFVILFALGGSVLAALISRIAPGSRGEGIPSYIRGVRDHGGVIPFRESFVKLFSSFATLASWGNGGFVGPLGRVVSGFTSSLIGLFKPAAGERSYRRTAAICGVASVVGVITGAPVGSGIFAVEIIQKRNMSYGDLFPSVLASAFAVFISRYLSFSHFFEVNVVIAPIRPAILPALLVTSLLTALGGRGFELLYSGTTRLLKRDSPKGVELRFAGAAGVAVGITWLVNPMMLGSGGNLLQNLFDNPSVVSGKLTGILPLALAALLMVVVRSISVGITVGSGQSAGFFGPLAQIGMLLGTFTAILFGYADSPGNLHILQAAGLAGMLASALNVPLAAAVIVSEIFGPHLGFPAAIAAILGFQLNRHHTVYDNPELRQRSVKEK